MSAARRPPRLDGARPAPAAPPSPPAFDDVLRRSRVAGRGTGLGPTELRRLIARIAAGDAYVLHGLEPFPGVTDDEVVVAVRAAFGASPARPELDPAAVGRGAHAAAAAIAAVGARGQSVLAATARPASLLGVQRSLAALAVRAGARLVELDDSSELRIDGRRGRHLRWVDGVACVTDGAHLHATTGPDAALELLFSVPRPGLVLADGAFATAAVAAGLPVVAAVGLEHAAVAVAARRFGGVVVLPLEPSRPPAAYRPVLALVERLVTTPATSDDQAPTAVHDRT